MAVPTSALASPVAVRFGPVLRGKGRSTCLTYPSAGNEVQVMSRVPVEPRREFLKQGLAIGLAAAAGQSLRPGQLLAASLDPDPEVPNAQVAQILKDLFGDRPIRRGQVLLDMPVVAEDGRWCRSSSRRRTCR